MFADTSIIKIRSVQIRILLHISMTSSNVTYLQAARH